MINSCALKPRGDVDGLERRLDPGPPVSDADLGRLSDRQLAERGVVYLPRALPEALAAFESDAVLTGALSPVIAQDFLKVKRAEYRAYTLEVHRWERKTYLEAL